MRERFVYFSKYTIMVIYLIFSIKISKKSQKKRMKISIKSEAKLHLEVFFNGIKLIKKIT